MGQLLHGSARTTAAVRRALQHSQESIAKLAERSGLNPKTVAQWKKRSVCRMPSWGRSSPPRQCGASSLSFPLADAQSIHEVAQNVGITSTKGHCKLPPKGLCTRQKSLS
jgi:hypothetical protein